jgi:CRP-like cAMP-binding protein
VITRTRPDLSALAGVAPFDRYDDRALAPLAAHADRLTVPAGTPLALEGRRARQVVVVVAGDAVVTRCGAEVGRLGPGAWLGARESLAGASHAETVVAGDDLAGLVLPDPAFRWAVQSLPGFATALPDDAGRTATSPCGDRAAGPGAGATASRAA